MSAAWFWPQNWYLGQIYAQQLAENALDRNEAIVLAMAGADRYLRVRPLGDWLGKLVPDADLVNRRGRVRLVQAAERKLR